LNILAVIVPSKAAPPAPNKDDADEDIDEPEAEFCFAPPQAAPNDVIKRSERRIVVRMVITSE